MKDTFLDQFVIAGGGIVYYVLIPMSVIAIYRIIELCCLIRRKRLVPPDIGNDIVSHGRKFSPAQLISRLAKGNDLVSRALYRALSQPSRDNADKRHIEHIAVEGLHDSAMRLFRRAELCNIIGNVAPMVGLFGTVYGMIQAFSLLGISGGQPRPDELAARISVALVTTFWGLLIAIPSLTFHGIFRTRIETLVSEAALEIETVLYQLKLLDRGAWTFGTAVLPTAAATAQTTKYPDHRNARSGASPAARSAASQNGPLDEPTATLATGGKGRDPGHRRIIN